MKKLLSLFLVTSAIGLFGCGKKKETLKYIKERCNIEEKLLEKTIKTTIYTSYAWEEFEDDYRKCERITTMYDSFDRKKDELHEIYNRNKDNDWCGYVRDVYEYDDKNMVESCYNFQYVTKRKQWFPESKTITHYDDSGKIIDKEKYWCTEFDSEDYESKFVLYYVYEYIYDENNNISIETCNKYNGTEKIYFIEKTEYVYNDDNQLVSKIKKEKTNYLYDFEANDISKVTRIKENDGEFEIKGKEEYLYENTLLISKTDYFYNSNKSYSRDMYNYLYDEDGKLLKETKYKDYINSSKEFIEIERKEYKYEKDEIVIQSYYHNITNGDDYWSYSGKEDIITTYVNSD